MKVVIDTSSLLSLVRYYLPFQKDELLSKFFKEKIEKHEIIILDKVVVESKRTAKGIVVEKLDFIKIKSNQVKTDLILPGPGFITDLENRLCYGSQKNKLSEIEFESRKNNFLESADAKLILYCLNERSPLEIDNQILVTEETRTENDNKLFKKLPEICAILDIESITLPTLLKYNFEMKFSDYLY